NAQDFAESIRDFLRIAGGGSRATGFVADGDVKLPVRSEMYRAAGVVSRTRKIIKIDNRRRSARGHVPIRCEAANPIVRRRGIARAGRHGVINVNILVRRKVWIERYAKQPAFAARINRQGNEIGSQ